MTIRVYLDNNDYSLLSDIRRVTPELNSIRERLIELAQSGQVEFRYSSVNVCELAPIDLQSVEAAERRADLLITLCGRKAFISLDEVIRLEVTGAYAVEKSPYQIISDIGDWFPPISPVFSVLETQMQMLQMVEESIQENATNRAQKRALKKKAIRNGKLRQSVLNNNSEVDAGIGEIIEQYPMREKDAKVLHKYFLGSATPEQAEQALLESLRDLRWMIKWFNNHSDKLSVIIDWVREPSQDLYKALINISGPYQQYRESLIRQGLDDKAIQRLVSERKEELKKEILVRLAYKVFALTHTDPPKLTAEHIKAKAPGLTMFVEAGIESMWNSINKNPRKPKDDDFVDSLHSMYAPYVDIFRADTYQAPIIRKAALLHGTIVVGKLSELIPEIEKKLAQQE